MNTIGENNEVRQLKLRIDYLKGRCAEEVEEYMALVTVGGDGIAARYMVEVGGLEQRVFELKLVALRWRRRLELRQQALNRGVAPDYVAIEQTVSAELEQYRKELEERRAAIDAVRKHLAMDKLSDEEVSRIRTGYLKAAKRLHPDLNARLSPDAAALWQKIQDAYSGQDWEELAFLVGLVDEVLKGEKAVALPNGLDALREQAAKLEKKLAGLIRKRHDLVKTKPFCYAELLDDEETLAETQAALRQKITLLEETISDYEMLWGTQKEAA